MTATALRTPPVAPAPAPAQAPLPPPQVKAMAAHPFAELLRQNRAASATPPARETASTPPQQSDEPHAEAESLAPSEPTNSDFAMPQRDARQAKARGAGVARDAVSTTKSETATPDAPTDEAAAPASDDKTPASPAPDASLIAGTVVNAGPAVAPSAQAATADPDGAAAATRGKGSATDSGRIGAQPARGTGLSLLGDGAQPGDSAHPAAGDPGNGRGVASNDRNDIAAPSDAGAARAAAALDAPASASFAGMLAESKTWHAATSVAHTNNDATTTVPQNTSLIASTTPGSTGVASAALPVPVHALEFAAAFGVQVSVLAKDGVQRAELHLNPAEMGPVSIQITLDGTQARVDFGADAAATRHAIEAGLPELASALRDAGFTLAGGGVAQHSASNGGNGGDAEAGRAASSRAGAARNSGLDAAATRLTRRVADGGVDLYA